MATSATYPLTLDLDAPLEVARWRPLAAWILAIPQLIIASVLGQVLQVLAVISWFAILFTGAIPLPLYQMMAMTLRYEWRAVTYALWLREPYPPFDFTIDCEDPGNDPASFSIEYPETLSRVLIFFKTWLLAIPHYVVLFFLWLGGSVVIVIAWFAVLITGRWPEGLRVFLVGLFRWTYRVQAYVTLMRDEYPPFSLQ